MTSILGATKFSVIPLSVEAKQVLVKLQRFAREASLGHVNPHELTIGSKCGLYLNEEGFCRVEVTDLSSRGKVVVKRWDLGASFSFPAICSPDSPRKSWSYRACVSGVLSSTCGTTTN